MQGSRLFARIDGDTREDWGPGTLRNDDLLKMGSPGYKARSGKGVCSRCNTR